MAWSLTLLGRFHAVACITTAALRSFTGRAESACSAPSRIAGWRRMHPSCCFHGTNRYSPATTSHVHEISGQSKFLTVLVHDPLACIRAFAFADSHSHTALAVTSWPVGYRVQEAIPDFTVPAPFLLSNLRPIAFSGRGRLIPLFRRQTLPPYLS